MRLSLGLAINQPYAVLGGGLPPFVYSFDFSKPKNSGYIATWSEDF